MLFVNLDSANFYTEISSTKETNRARFMCILLTNSKIRVTFGKFLIYMKEKVEIHLVQYRLCSCLMKLKYLLRILTHFSHHPQTVTSIFEFYIV